MNGMRLRSSCIGILWILMVSILVPIQAEKIAVLGAGYVGLITAACFADMGNHVHCLDTDSSKIDLLNAYTIPIYEPGLEALVIKNSKQGRLKFSTNFDEALDWANTIFVAVGTPMSYNGCADLTAVHAAISLIVPHLNQHKYICIKSTVPVGTCQSLHELLLYKGIDAHHFDIVSNPEFLREGSAIADFTHPDRIVIGAHNELAHEYMQRLYASLIQGQNVPCVRARWATSELIKYASNAFLAIKISFINEIANLCDETGADVQDVALGMGLDKRIGSAFLRPGPGFGGSCFPKDCTALEYIANQHDVPAYIVQAALTVNEKQKQKPIEKLIGLMGKNLVDKTIAILGLAFKGDTDDVRHSPALTVIEFLSQAGAHIRAFDPAAMENMHKIWPTITYTSSAYEAVTNADAVIIMTEWPEFKKLDIQKIALLVKEKVLVDARNLFDPEQLRKYAFKFALMGRA